MGMYFYLLLKIYHLDVYTSMLQFLSPSCNKGMNNMTLGWKQNWSFSFNYKGLDMGSTNKTS
jgi:hypothetical protein